MSDHLVIVKVKQTNTNTNFDIQISTHATVLDLKKSLFEKSGLNESQQNLVYKGRILSDEKLLSDYNIQNDHTIILVKRISQEEKKQGIFNIIIQLRKL